MNVMKNLILAGSGLALSATVLLAPPPEPNTPMRKSPPPPPPLYQDTSLPSRAPQQAPVYVYEQKPMPGRPVLLTGEQAQSIIDRFKSAYPQLGSPRFLVYVNRELIEDPSGIKLSQRTERIESTRTQSSAKHTGNSVATNPPPGQSSSTTTRSTHENTYRADDNAARPALADKQTIRDVERLFGRPLRAAGANLADQRVASQLLTDKPIGQFIGTTESLQARKEREALLKVADAVIEVLISSKTITVPTVSGDQNISVPDIQATAVSLKDARVLGQASSSDVTMRVPPASLRYFDVREITEATALALMEDMSP